MELWVEKANEYLKLNWLLCQSVEDTDNEKNADNGSLLCGDSEINFRVLQRLGHLYVYCGLIICVSETFVFYWDNQCWPAKDEKSAVINKRSASY